MFIFLSKRIVSTIPVLFLVTFAVFGLMLLVPGDPATTIAGPDATEQQVQAIRERLGLNDPFLVRYWHWLMGLFQGDLGTSLFTSRPVSATISEALPVTLSLTLTSLVVSLLIAVPAAFASGLRRGTWIDKLATLGSTLGIALPSFWMAIILVLIFATGLGWFPVTGYVPLAQDPAAWATHLVLPAVTLGLASAAESTRQLRGSVITVLQQDYVRTAYSKGLRMPKIIGKHVLKNASVPLITVLGLQFATLLGGAVLVEVVFGIPGLGQAAINAVSTRDIPVVQGIVLVAGVVAMLTNLAVDLAYGYLNPKVRVN